MATSSVLLRSVKALVYEMRRTGNREGVVQQWKNKIAEWLKNNPNTVDAQAISSMLPLWQVRPFYTVSELAPLVPALFVSVGIRDNPGPAYGPATLRNALIKSGLPMLGQGAFYKHPITGQEDQYFIVERIHHWANRPIDQKDFEIIWLTSMQS